MPRAHIRAGGRLRLHPNDLLAFGPHRGAFNERWLASNVKANNGPDTRPDEGLSYVEFGGELTPLAEITGDGWQVLRKLLGHRWNWNLKPSSALCRAFLARRRGGRKPGAGDRCAPRR